MQRTATVNLPLHPGTAPPWLFHRMVKMSSAITEVLVMDYGPDEFVRRISNPYWFQALSCVLGFDWHSSGTTTVTCGALKEALKHSDLGISVAGGKGRASRKTPQEIEERAEHSSLSTARIERLKYASKMAAKVDSAVLQDSYTLYHHCFFFTDRGRWAVVQQGMNEANHYARRYHWLSDSVTSFVNEPRDAVCCDVNEPLVLDMSAEKSSMARATSLDIIRDNPAHLQRYCKPAAQQTLLDFNRHAVAFTLAPRHDIADMASINLKTLQRAHELQPQSYEELVSLPGIGAKTVRSLALIASLVYGDEVSWQDPVKYSFAHGGKDGIPYPVDKQLMDSSTEILRSAVEQARLAEKDKINALRQLRDFMAY